MIDALLDLPSHLRERLAQALESGSLAPPYSQVSLRSVLGSHAEGIDRAYDAFAELQRLAVPGPAAAAWLRSLARVSGRTPQVDLVWSGPEVPGVHARDTRRVYEELLSSAERSVWASTYVFFDGPRAFAVLASRMDETPTLAVTLFLNIQRRRGDSTAADHLVRAFAERFWNTEWPGASRPRVYYDPRALEPNGAASVLHAKALVVDDEAVFVTSANFTEAALDRNIELGLLLRDPNLAKTVSTQLQALIDQGILIALPST